MLRRIETNATDRIVYDGQDLSRLVSCRIMRPIMAPVDVSSERIGAQHGEAFRHVRLSAYDLPVEMHVRSVDRRAVAETRHRLASMLYREAPAPLVLPDDPARHLMAIVSGGTDLGEITDECPVATVTFRVVDPVYYGQARSAEVAGGSESAIDVGGTWPARVEVEARPGVASAWRLSNLDTGQFVEIRRQFTADSVVRVDMSLERATLNRQTVAVTLDSDFFEVRGRNRLMLSSGTAVLRWHERWL